MSVPYTQWDPNRRPSQDFLSRSGLSPPQLLFQPQQAQGTLLSHQHGLSAGDLGRKVMATVGAVSEQQQFLNKVRSCIQLGDIGRLAEILNAAERSTRAWWQRRLFSL